MASGSSSKSHTHNQPEHSYPNAESVIEESASYLLNDQRYVCRECSKGFPREQNLTLHMRVHNLNLSLKPKVEKPLGRKVYLCPETTCKHHNRSHALGDFGGLKKHYLRKHSTEKNHKCDVCSKTYAAESDLKAHVKVCGKRRHVCHCGARFERGNNLAAHKEYCDGQSPTLQMGESSSKMPTNSNNSHLIGSTGENSMRRTNNDNPCSLIGLYAHSDPHIAAFQNLSKSNLSVSPDQSQLYPSIIDNGSLMTDHSFASNLGQIFPEFFCQASTQQNQNQQIQHHQNQDQLQADFDPRFYTDLLMDEMPLDNVNFMGDGWHTFENGQGSNSNTVNGVILDQNVMPNHVFGEGSSGFNQELNGDLNGQSNYGYDQSNYGYGTEVSNVETSAETAREVAPSGQVAPGGQILEQFRGFWF